jgi:hypothetical protein
LDYDGTGTNNTLGNLLPNPPNGTSVYKFTGTGYAVDSFLGVWNDPTVTLNPGEGAFIYNPTLSPITNTFVGTVWQGTNNVTVQSGFSMQGYPAPIAGAVSTKFAYPAANGDSIFLWNGSSNTFAVYSYLGGWSPQDPTINVGQAFFIYRGGVATNWPVIFTVQ